MASYYLKHNLHHGPRTRIERKYSIAINDHCRQMVCNKKVIKNNCSSYGLQLFISLNCHFQENPINVDLFKQNVIFHFNNNKLFKRYINRIYSR